ncbi:tetratricopeptide repeat protein, partial [Myxococcota bacterium]|nr:tetratricopeptide repeat protein [Myxococcota bacterium]
LVYLEEDPSSLQSPVSAPALGVWVGLRQGVGAPREETLSRLKAALERAPNSFELKTVLARFYASDPESVEQSALLLEEAIADAPDYLPSRLSRIELLVQNEGQEEEILAEWNEAARIDPKDPTFGHEAALIVMRQGKEAEALDLLHAHLENFPWYGDSAMEIADIKIRDNDTGPETLMLARLAAELGFSDRARSRDILGQVRLARGELLEAEEVFSKSIQLRPARPQSHYYLGLVFEEQGRPGRAVESFERALELGDFEQAEDARSRVMKHEPLAESSLPVEENKADNE